MQDTQIPPNPSSNVKRYALVAVAGIALAGIGLAAGLTLRATPATAQEDTYSSTAPTAATATAATDTSTPGAQAPATNDAAQAAQRARREAAERDRERDRERARERQQLAARQAQPVVVAAAPVCADCGVVASVRAVQVKGSGTGLGAVAGGVLGGVVGHQMGGGNGKSALTLLGAIGGGLAGNEVEKRERAQTLYQIEVRMDDGSTRTFTEANAPAVGARVRVDGNGLHLG